MVLRFPTSIPFMLYIISLYYVINVPYKIIKESTNFVIYIFIQQIERYLRAEDV